MTEYGKALMANPTIRALGKKVNNGSISSKEMNRLTGEYGKVAGECMAKQLLEDFPNGHASEDNVRQIVSPILRENHKLVTGIAVKMLNAQYERAGVGLKAVSPDYDIHKEDELVREISQRSFEDGLG